MTAEQDMSMAPLAAASPRPRMLALPGRILRSLPGKEGAFWVLFAVAAPKLMGPVFTVLLRRFAGPGTSGIFDLASTPYKFLDNFRNFGTGPALVYERQVSRQVVNTAWCMNMIMAVIVTAIANLLAHPITAYYGHPEVENVFRLLSIAYVFASITSVHFYLLLRDFDYRARSIPPVGQVIAAGDVALIFAIWGFGSAAFVARELTSVILGAVLLWVVYPYRPSLQLVPSIAWKLFKYGAWVGAGLTVLFMSQNVDVFIGGHVIRKASDIGFYTTSWKLAFIAAGVFTLVGSSMVFPSLSKLQDDMGALRAKLLKSIRQMGLIMFPAAALLASVAPVLIVPVLGEKYAAYRSSFLVLTLLAVYAGNRTMLSVFFEGYKSIGRPWIVWAYNFVKLLIMIPSMIFGAQHGITGLALVYIPIQVIEFPVALYLANRILQTSPREVWKAAWIPIVSTLIMVAGVVVVETALKNGGGLGDSIVLASCLAVGFITYLGSLLVFDRRILSEARTVLVRGL